MNFDVGHVSLLLGLLGTLIGTTWKMARLVERVELHVATFEKAAKMFEEMPLIRRDLDHLRGHVDELRETVFKTKRN